MSRRLAALTCLLFAAHGAAADDPPPAAQAADGAGPSGEALMAHVAFLAGQDLHGRKEPEDRAKAAEHVALAFKAAGLSPAPGAKDYRLPFPKKEGKGPGENVVGWIQGTDPTEYVIASAHYDGIGRAGARACPGADDDATGVAALVELARSLAAGPRPKRSVMCVAFDLEEDRLVGSTVFAEDPPLPLARCAAFTTADMLGRSLADLYPGTLLVYGSERAAGLEAALAAVRVPAGSELVRLGSDFDALGWSDQVPFERRKVPSLLFTSGASRDRHTANDTPERIDLPHFAANASIWIDAVRALADAPERPAWRDAPPLRVDEVRAVASLVGRAETSERLALPDDQRLLLVEYRKMLEAIVSRGAVTLGERTAVRVGALQLFEAFRTAPAK